MADPRDYEPEHAHGGMSKWMYEDDPKRLAISLARYKHVAKMLEGYGNVLEVGCADGFGSRIVRQHVDRLTAIDTDARSIEEAQHSCSGAWPITFLQADIRNAWPPPYRACLYEAVYALDVLEHIRPDDEFLQAMHRVASVAVIGTPSLESQAYASEMSRLGHVNCYSGQALRARLLEFWPRVFLFTMHDEVLGTSYLPMAHYLLALCVR